MCSRYSPVSIELISLEIRGYLNKLVAKYPSIQEIWLIGSRVNRSAEAKDWDFIVFADEDALAALEKDADFDMPDIDLLIVYDGDRFKKPRGNKSGSLTEWGWRIIDPMNGKAQYQGSKRAGSEINIQCCQAIRVWQLD